jgi:hypothetical protein
MQPIYKQINDLRGMWQELWWAMAGGKMDEYHKIKGTNVFEFWKIFDLWKAQTARQREALRQQSKKK